MGNTGAGKSRRPRWMTNLCFCFMIGVFCLNNVVIFLCYRMVSEQHDASFSSSPSSPHFYSLGNGDVSRIATEWMDGVVHRPTNHNGNNNKNNKNNNHNNNNNNKNKNKNKNNNKNNNNNNNNNNSNNDDDLPVFSICLLTRDDLSILPEWIAYHYHAVRLRHLVVAVDPTSAKDPGPILENFRRRLNGTLIVEQWADGDFMPGYFLEGDYGRAPNFVGGQGKLSADNQTWYEWYSKKKNFGFRRRRDQTLINNHRYRQTRFLSRCSEHLRDAYGGDGGEDKDKENGKGKDKENRGNHLETAKAKTKTKTRVWMSTLDSDEYLAINPWRMPTQKMAESSPITKAALRLEPGSLLRWWVDQERSQTAATSKDDPVCRQIPRLLFGSVELPPTDDQHEDVVSGIVAVDSSTDNNNNNNNDNNNDNNRSWRLSREIPRRNSTLETLRWKFHASPSDERNAQQKVALDLQRIPKDDEIWGDHVLSVHRPSRSLCSPETSTNERGSLLVPGQGRNRKRNGNRNRNRNRARARASPVVAYHYLGSEERYFSRPDDFRRSPEKYRERSNITYARDDSGWIDQWLEGFVETVGVETAAALLVPPPTTKTTKAKTTTTTKTTKTKTTKKATPNRHAGTPKT